MLSQTGLPIPVYTKILTNTDKFWSDLVNRDPSSAERFSFLLNDPYILYKLDSLDVLPDSREEIIKRTLLILKFSLGNDLLNKFFSVQELEVVASTLPFALDILVNSTESVTGVANAKGINNLQISVLYSVLEQLTNECGGKEPQAFLLDILNQIHLPYFVHQSLESSVSQAMDGRVYTVN